MQPRKSFLCYFEQYEPQIYLRQPNSDEFTGIPFVWGLVVVFLVTIFTSNFVRKTQKSIL